MFGAIEVDFKIELVNAAVILHKPVLNWIVCKTSSYKTTYSYIFNWLKFIKNNREFVNRQYWSK